MISKGTEKVLKGGVSTAKGDIWAKTSNNDGTSSSARKQFDRELKASKGEYGQAKSKDIVASESHGTLLAPSAEKKIKAQLKASEKEYSSTPKSKGEFNSDSRIYQNVEGA